MRKPAVIAAALALLTVPAVRPASAAFVVGGENGWQLSTDGIIDVFATYQSTSPLPSGGRFPSFLGGDATASQNFGVRVGLLPSVVAFNVKAPTMNGIDSTVRVGIYPNIQNTNKTVYDSTGKGVGGLRFDTSPNIDFREIYYNAKGSFGEILAGRALNLYQGKNILTDMTLLTAGVVGAPGGGTTLGHIGYGYLYTNFGPQIRYTTPDMSGVKVAFSVNEPYKISGDTGKTNRPRIESEISYATTYGQGNTFQAWGSALYESATRKTGPGVARPGATNTSVGGAAGAQTVVKGLEIMASGYFGEGLGMISAQDGDFGAAGISSTDMAGKERTHFGFLAQATYKVSDTVKVGVNYGQNRQLESNNDKATRGGGYTPMKKQEAAAAMLAYNLTKSIQFVGEYTYSQNTWHDRATQHAHSFAIGTMYYW